MNHKCHELKILPEYFKAVIMGDKNFEIRNNDRDFRVGDTILLREYDSRDGYTGNETERRITYITDYEQKEGFVVMSIKV